LLVPRAAQAQGGSCSSASKAAAVLLLRSCFLFSSRCAATSESRFRSGSSATLAGGDRGEQGAGAEARERSREQAGGARGRDVGERKMAGKVVLKSQDEVKVEVTRGAALASALLFEVLEDQDANEEIEIPLPK
jgi:hypothetical protein